jgi:acyl carrier protein
MIIEKYKEKEPKDYEHLEKLVCTFISKELCENEIKLEPHTPFETVGIDSIFLMEIILYCENLCGRRVPIAVLGSEESMNVRTLLKAI